MENTDVEVEKCPKETKPHPCIYCTSTSTTSTASIQLQTFLFSTFERRVTEVLNVSTKNKCLTIRSAIHAPLHMRHPRLGSSKSSPETFAKSPCSPSSQAGSSGRCYARLGDALLYFGCHRRLPRTPDPFASGRSKLSQHRASGSYSATKTLVTGVPWLPVAVGFASSMNTKKKVHATADLLLIVG